jgi:lipopolysaccharide/colanic/teichoic acid biosynthesis glycosyltransferase
MRRWRATSWPTRLFAACLIALLSPLVLLLWAAVKLDSPGPFLFRQRRTGYRGREFEIYKIRTMANGSERMTALGTRGDGRYVTRVGRMLRKLKLDELPQLWNVARGEMAIVGPRPIPVPLYEELCRHIPDFPLRNEVPPGLTNLSQISLADNKLGPEMIADWRLRFDGEMHYIRNKNAWYDVAIVLMTTAFVLRRALRRRRADPPARSHPSPLPGSGATSDPPERATA